MLHISLCSKNAEECKPVVLTGKQKPDIIQKLLSRRQYGTYSHIHLGLKSKPDIKPAEVGSKLT
jgi:hypothetical protein